MLFRAAYLGELGDELNWPHKECFSGLDSNTDKFIQGHVLGIPCRHFRNRSN
jgi:hypothetical protein